MERLGAAQNRGQSLHGDAHDVVVRLLRCEGAAGRLGMEAKHHRLGIFGVEAFLHDLGPHAASRPELGHLLEQVVMGVEEESQPRGEFIDIKPCLDGSIHIGDAVGQGKGDFLNSAGTCFADVIAGDTDGVPLGDLVLAVGKDVGDDAHGLPLADRCRCLGPCTP